MAINRYDRPVQYDFSMQHYVPTEFVPNFEAWDEALALLQTEKDAAELISDKIPQHHTKDVQNVTKWREGIDSEVNAIADLYSNQSISEARRRQRDLVRKISRDFQPGGEAFSYEKNLEAITEYQKSLMENENVDPVTKQLALAKSLEQFPGTISDVKGQYNTFAGRPVSDTIELTKEANELLKGWASDKYPKGVFTTQDGRFIDLSTMETIDPRVPFKFVTEAFAANPKISAFLKDMEELHGADPNELIAQAAAFGAEKIGFTKINPKLMVDSYKFYDHRQDAENSIISFERFGAGLETNMPWSSPNVGAVNDFIKSNEDAIKGIVYSFIGKTNMTPEQKTNAINKLEGKDLATGDWFRKLGFKDEATAMTSLGISKGIINDAISVYNAKAKENQVAQYHIERAEEHAKEELKKKNINIGDFEQKVDIILNNVISKGVYFTDKSEISRTELINHIKSDNVTVVPTKEGYNRYYIDGKEVEASGEMISAMRSYERENANLRGAIKLKQRAMNESLSQNYISKSSPTFTTDMPVAGDQKMVNAFRKGLVQELSNPGPGVLAITPGSTTVKPLVDIFNTLGATKIEVGDNVGWSQNTHINGEKTWEVNYRITVGSGEDKKVVPYTVYVPISSLKNSHVDEYMNSAEVKAQFEIEYAANNNLDKYEVTDANGVIIHRDGSSKIKDIEYNAGETKAALTDYYYYKEIQNRFGLDTYEDAKAFVKAMSVEQTQ